MLLVPLLLISDEQSRSKFEELYAAYHDVMRNVAMRITGNEYDAEDALQAAFFSVAEHVERIRTDHPSETKVYLCKIVRNEALDVVKANGSRPLELQYDEMDELPADTDLEKTVEGEETYRQIVSTIARLPKHYRDVLELRFLGELSTFEIARLLKRKRGVVRNQLARGTKILRETLKEVLKR